MKYDDKMSEAVWAPNNPSTIGDDDSYEAMLAEIEKQSETRKKLLKIALLAAVVSGALTGLLLLIFRTFT